MVMIKKETAKHINKIPDSPSLYEIQIIALCRTAYLLLERTVNKNKQTPRIHIITTFPQTRSWRKDL